MFFNNPGHFTTLSNEISENKEYFTDFDPYMGRNIYPVSEGVYINDVLFVPSCPLGVGNFDKRVGFHISRNISSHDGYTKATVDDMSMVSISFKLLFSATWNDQIAALNPL